MLLGGAAPAPFPLGGRGQFRDWEIFNRPGKGKDLPYTFFAIYSESAGTRESHTFWSASSAAVFHRIRALHGPRLRPASPDEATFYGEYPFARIEFHDEQSARFASAWRRSTRSYQ